MNNRKEQAIQSYHEDAIRRRNNGLTETFDDYYLDGVRWADKHPKSPWIDINKERPKPLNKFVIDSDGTVIDIHLDDKEESPDYLCHKPNGFFFMARPYESLQGLMWYGANGSYICELDKVDYYMVIPVLPKEGGGQ